MNRESAIDYGVVAPFVDGKFTESESDAIAKVINPSNGRRLLSIPAGSEPTSIVPSPPHVWPSIADVGALMARISTSHKWYYHISRHHNNVWQQCFTAFARFDRQRYAQSVDTCRCGNIWKRAYS